MEPLEPPKAPEGEEQAKALSSETDPVIEFQFYDTELNLKYDSSIPGESVPEGKKPTLSKF